MENSLSFTPAGLTKVTSAGLTEASRSNLVNYTTIDNVSPHTRFASPKWPSSTFNFFLTAFTRNLFCTTCTACHFPHPAGDWLCPWPSVRLSIFTTVFETKRLNSRSSQLTGTTPPHIATRTKLPCLFYDTP